MRKCSLRFFAALAACCMLMTMATAGFAQRRGVRAPAYTRAEVDRLIHRVEDRSDAFVGLFDRALDRSALDGSEREDRLNERAKDLEKELDNVRKEFDRAEGYLEIRSHVAKAMNVSEGINNVLRSRRMNAAVERQWALLRAELNKLARVYNLRALKS